MIYQSKEENDIFLHKLLGKIIFKEFLYFFIKFLCCKEFFVKDTDAFTMVK